MWREALSCERASGLPAGLTAASGRCLRAGERRRPPGGTAAGTPGAAGLMGWAQPPRKGEEGRVPVPPPSVRVGCVWWGGGGVRERQPTPRRACVGGRGGSSSRRRRRPASAPVPPSPLLLSARREPRQPPPQRRHSPPPRRAVPMPPRGR